MASSGLAIWFGVLMSSFARKSAELLARHGTKAADSIKFLQWNMHGECFRECPSPSHKHCDKFYPACKGNATAFLKELVNGHNEHAPNILDFAGIEQLNDEKFLESGLDADSWAQFTHICGGSRGYGVWPFDSATILYNKREWDVVNTGGSPHAPIGGCMEKVQGSSEDNSVNPIGLSVVGNYRAFIMQAFKRRSDGMQIIVIVSHHPHTLHYADEILGLKRALQEVQQHTGVTKVVLVADTNWNYPRLPFLGRSSESITHDIYPNASGVVSTVLQKTCCAWHFFAAYDRIIAAGFPGAMDPIKTMLPFGNETPMWMALNMHKPITGTLTYARSEPSV